MSLTKCYVSYILAVMFDLHSSSHHSLREHALNVTIALYRVTDYFPKSEVLRNDLRAKANEIFQRVSEHGADTQCDASVEFLTGKIDTMKGYLKIARTLEYVRPVNFVILEKEYDIIAKFLEDERAQYARSKSAHEDINNPEHAFFLYPQAKKDAKGLKSKEERGMYGDSVPYNIEESKKREINPETRPLNGGFHRKTDAVLNERQRIIMDRLAKSGQGKISDFYTSLRGVSSKTIQRDLQNLVDKEILKKEGEKRWTVYSVIEHSLNHR